MARGPDKSEKTEKPTAKRLREARERGQVPKSTDLVAWSSLLVGTFLLGGAIDRLADAMTGVLHDMGEAIAAADLGAATRFAADAALRGLVAALPLLLGLALVAVVVGVAQLGGGVRPYAKRLKPQFKRLNPFAGLRNMVSAHTGWEVTKAVLKTAVLVVVAWPIVADVATALSTSGGSLDALVGTTTGAVFELMRNIAFAGLVISVADYLVNRHQVMTQLRMTKHEVKEEMKNQEGNPLLRSAIRSRMSAMSRNRMIANVADADVVVVNPTHYAVALRYQAERGAPEVVAKGAGAVAQRIRERAEESGVPIVREVMLTRMLYRACEVGQFIPVELYEAVARLLAFIFALRAEGRARGSHELPAPLVPIDLGDLAGAR